MITFALIRYGVFASFMFLDGLVGIFSALNLGFVANLPTNDEIKAIGIYLITLSLLVILFVFPILGVEITKKRPLTSRVWFETCWVAVFTGMHLGGAIGATLSFPDALCRFRGASQTSCNTSLALLVFIWASTFIHISYLLLIVLMALFARERVWNQPIHQYAWFGASQQQRRGQPIMGYNETPLRFSESSNGSDKEKGWNFLPLNNHSTDRFEIPVLPPLPPPPKPIDYLEGLRIEPYRMERHPYQTAEPAVINIQPPPPAKVANPVTYKDWNGPVMNIEGRPLSIKVEPSLQAPSVMESSGLSPVVFKVGQKTTIVQAPGTKITQAELSLYPQAVTNAGLNTRPLSTASPGPIVGGRRKRESGHVQVPSTDSTMMRERPPKHRPPPLDLSSVSNLNSSSNRRR